MQTILYVTAEVLRIIAIMTQPFMPASMEKLLGLLSVPANAREISLTPRPRKVSWRERFCPRPRRFFRVTSMRKICSREV